MSLNSASKNQQTLEVEVKFLEDERTQIFYVPINVTGKWLLDEICKFEEIEDEKEYFGLRYIRQDQNVATKTWLDCSKSINSQLKSTFPKVVSFRVKHYPANPLIDLTLPKSQYLLYHQVKRDLNNGRLVGRQEQLILIAALITQVELGDYSVVSKNGDDYLEDFKILHNQTQPIREAIIKKHETLETLLPSEAANTVLQYACELDTYGVDPIKVRAKAFEKHKCFLGLNHKGVLEFLSSNLNSVHEWNNISKMYCDKKRFIISVKKHDNNNKRKITREYEYKCNNSLTADSLWSWAEDSRIFFTAEKSDRLKPIKSKKGLFSRSHTFTFSGRTRNEILSKYSESNLPSDELIILMNQFGSQKHLNLISTDSLPRSVANVVTKRPRIDNLLDNDLAKVDSDTVSIYSKDITPDNQLKYSTLPNNVKPGSKTNIYGTASSKGQPKQLQHWQMASFFDLPKRKFLPEAEARQNKLMSILECDEETLKLNLEVLVPLYKDGESIGKSHVSVLASTSPRCLSRKSSIISIKVNEKIKMANGEEITITSEDDDLFTASEALKVDAALGELNQVLSEADAKSREGWFSKLVGSIKERIFGSTKQDSFKMTSYKDSKASKSTKTDSKMTPWVFTASLILALSVLGFIVIVEKDVDAIRSVGVFKALESSVYAPMRNLLFPKNS